MVTKKRGWKEKDGGIGKGVIWKRRSGEGERRERKSARGKEKRKRK